MDIEKAVDILNHLVFCGSCTTGPCKDCDRKNAKDTAIQGLQELQQYRQIGTVDECRAAREKQIAKEPKIHISEFQCPNCGMENLEEIDDLGHIYLRHKYCPDCGQALKWED